MTQMTAVEPRIVYIPLSELHPHPDNPRADLGDLSELTGSIKSHGILQNLTVVPREAGGYTVLIGHRRTEGARQAGLSEAPCTIVEGMSHAEQVAVMMVENLQRADLTLYEQAQGFQMMMDLGMSVAKISERTGFSDATVRRRLRMAELPAETFARVSREHQIRMEELEKIYKIKAPDVREKVLAAVGTKDFEATYRRALDEQKAQELLVVVRAYLLADGGIEQTEAELNDRSVYSADRQVFYIEREADVARYIEMHKKSLLRRNGDRYGFCLKVAYGACVIVSMIRRLRAGEAERVVEETAAEQEMRDRRQERLRALDHALASAKALRDAFMCKMREGKALVALPKSALYLCEEYGGYHAELDRGEIDRIVTGERPDKYSLPQEDEFGKVFEMTVRTSPAKALAVTAYLLMERYSFTTYERHTGEYIGEDAYAVSALQDLYDFLASFGYEISDFERGLLDGTSELYAEVDGDE